MSYHTHNLIIGDIFGCNEYVDVDHDGGKVPYHLFEVLDVEHANGYLDKNGWNMHLVAKCLACGKIFNGVVSKCYSLCMHGYGPDDFGPAYMEYNETVDELVARWNCHA